MSHYMSAQRSGGGANAGNSNNNSSTFSATSASGGPQPGPLMHGDHPHQPHHQHHHQQHSSGVPPYHHQHHHTQHHHAGPNPYHPLQGTVMMVYGLNLERINCDKLFNLFCLYGNVVRVKFLHTIEGCAMVQMGDALAVGRCVASLDKITLFGNEIQVGYSKQAFLHDVIQPFTLPDGSPSFKDFMDNKNNRFKNPELASKNRILPPSQVLHFFNAPFGVCEDELMHLFRQTTGHEPVSVKIFTPKGEQSKSYSGLITFKDPAEATEALVLCNHSPMPKAGNPHPYILRLCFSPPVYNNKPVN